MLISSESVRLLVGFTAGQVQLIDPIKKELSKLFNEEVTFLYHIFLGLFGMIIFCGFSLTCLF